MAHESILIVEDDEIIAEDLRLRLVQMKYEVVGIVDSGEQAVVLARNLRPDIVFMDGSLRGAMDGFEAGELIENSLACPVVYVTSNPRAGKKTYWVSKPYTTAALASVAARVLTRRAPQSLRAMAAAS